MNQLQDLTLGQYTLSAVLAVVLGIVFKVAPNVPDQYRPLCSVSCGIVLSYLFMVGLGIGFEFKNLVTYGINGLMIAANASGLYTFIKKT